MVKIGVFDSGIGGLSVARAIEKAVPEHQVVFMNDQTHMPYGNKPMETVYELTKPVIDTLINLGCEVIVIACNTVTTNLIGRLRADYDIPFVAVEPMVKPAAAQTASGVIAVCATPATLASERYAWLKQTYAAGIKVLEPDCSDWAAMIEHKTVDARTIKARIEAVIAEGADVIVLGCTHYHWIEREIKHMARGRAVVIQPEQALVRQLKRVLAERGAA